MWQVVIVLNNTNANLSLSYKTKEAAEMALTYFTDTRGGLKYGDDFGYIVMTNESFISYILFVDLEESQVCMFEQDICKRRAEKKIIERLNANPEEMALFPAQNQPQRPQAPSRIIQ